MKTLITMAAVLLLGACGGSSPGASSSDLAAYRSSALAASTALSSYQAAVQTMTTTAECQAAAQQYAAQMGAAIQGMHDHSAVMDDQMRAMGQAAAADVTCGADVMAQQLREHLGTACSSGDVTRDRTVAEEHCQLMTNDMDHLRMRAAAMGTASGSAGASGSGTCDGMMGCGDQACDGGDCVTGGFTSADGHHMNWGEPMQGCAMCGGTYQTACGATAG